MVTLTQEAAEAVRRLQEERAEPGQLLRLWVEAGGCSGFEYGMGFSAKTEKDTELESAGVRFLVDRKSLERLRGSEVHFDDGLNGKGFEIRNPNADNTCGCGRSFA